MNADELVLAAVLGNGDKLSTNTCTEGGAVALYRYVVKHAKHPSKTPMCKGSQPQICVGNQNPSWCCNNRTYSQSGRSKLPADDGLHSRAYAATPVATRAAPCCRTLRLDYSSAALCSAEAHAAQQRLAGSNPMAGATVPYIRPGKGREKYIQSCYHSGCIVLQNSVFREHSALSRTGMMTTALGAG